jgi:hypothetical protein
MGARAPTRPEQWEGVVSGQEYSVDTLGTVTNSFGSVIANPHDVGAMVVEVRGRPGGRFRVTPGHRLVLVWKEGEGPYVAGQLCEPFSVADPGEGTPVGEIDVDALGPGDVYPGVPSKEGGTFKLSQKRGGVIEHRAKGGTEFALLEGGDDPAHAANAHRVLEAWRKALDRGVTFHVTDEGHAWYLEGGKPKFLASVPKGFAWPSTTGKEP